MALSADQKQSALAMTAEKRNDYFNKHIEQNQMVWTIVDDEGVMLLVSDEEDCMPVWSDAIFVEDWINGDWSGCKAHGISMQDWQQKWLPGLDEDEIEIVVFPVPEEGGMVVSPWELMPR